MQPQSRLARQQAWCIGAGRARRIECRHRPDQRQTIGRDGAPADAAGEHGGIGQRGVAEPLRDTRKVVRVVTDADGGIVVVVTAGGAEQQAAIGHRQHVAAAGDRHLRPPWRGAIAGPADLAALALQPLRRQGSQAQRIGGGGQHQHRRGIDRAVVAIEQLPVVAVARDALHRRHTAPGHARRGERIAHQRGRVDPTASGVEPGRMQHAGAGMRRRGIGVKGLHVGRWQPLALDQGLHCRPRQLRLEAQQAVGPARHAAGQRSACGRGHPQRRRTVQPRVRAVVAHHRTVEEAGGVAGGLGSGLGVAIDHGAGDALAGECRGTHRARQSAADDQRVAGRLGRHRAAGRRRRDEARCIAGQRDVALAAAADRGMHDEAGALQAVAHRAGRAPGGGSGAGGGQSSEHREHAAVPHRRVARRCEAIEVEGVDARHQCACPGLHIAERQQQVHTAAVEFEAVQVAG